MIKIYRYSLTASYKVSVVSSATSIKGNFSTVLFPKIIHHQVRMHFNITSIDIESNGILLGEFMPKKWYFFAIDHDRPFLSRPTVTSVINEKQQTI